MLSLVMILVLVLVLLHSVFLYTFPCVRSHVLLGLLKPAVLLLVVGLVVALLGHLVEMYGVQNPAFEERTRHCVT